MQMDNKFSRLNRINEQIKKDISNIIQTKIRDPRIGYITITEVKITADYSQATIYYTILEEDKKESTKQALEHAKGFLRKELGSLLTIFKTPELIFKYDTSIERSANITKLIDQISKNK